MAVDHALLEAVQAGAPPTVRLYRWAPAALSLGRNQFASGVFDRGRAAALSIDIVRRPTGGAAVYHDREITYAVAVPAALLGGARRTYREIHRALVAGLRLLGVDARIADGGAPVRPRAADPCFVAPAPGEVVLGARKLVGSAQRAERRTLLQHGSVLLDGTQRVVVNLQCATPGASRALLGTAAVDSAAITLAEALGRAPAVQDVIDALSAGFGAHCGIRLAPAPLSAAERARASILEAHYRSAEWTWRR